MSKVLAIGTSVENKNHLSPVAVREFILDQAKTWSYCQVSLIVWFPGSMFSYDKRGFLTRTVLTNEAVPKVVPTSLQPHLLHHSNHPSFAIHLGGRGMYDSTWKEFQWLPWPMTITVLWWIVTNVSEMSCRKSDYVLYDYSRHAVYWNSLQLTS